MDFGIVCRKIFERGTGKEEIIFSFARDRRSCEILILQSLDRLRPVRGSRDGVACRFDLSRCERVELTRPGVRPLPADAGPEFHVRGDLRSAHHIRRTGLRSEEHTSELQSLMRISYAVFCLKK